GNAPEVDLIKNCLNLHGVSPKGSSSSPLLGSRLMNMRWPVARAWRARPPGGQAVSWRTRRRIEATLVRFASVDGALHGVIHLQDDPLGAVLAVLRFVLAFDDVEGLHDVVHIVAGDAVEVEIASSSQRSRKRRASF